MSNDTHDGATPPEPFDRLKSLWREMFQLDRGDLDFGLYRIMGMRAGEIEDFLDRDLLTCSSARVFDADRHCNLLNKLDSRGSRFDALE